MADRRLPAGGTITLGDVYQEAIDQTFLGGPTTNVNISAYRRAASGTPVADYPVNQNIQTSTSGPFKFTQYYYGWQGDGAPPPYLDPNAFTEANNVAFSGTKLNPAPGKNVGDTFNFGVVDFSSTGIPTIGFTGGQFLGTSTVTLTNLTPTPTGSLTNVSFVIDGNNSSDQFNRDTAILNITGQTAVTEPQYFYRNSLNAHLYANISTTSASAGSTITISGVLNVRTKDAAGNSILPGVRIGDVEQLVLSAVPNGTVGLSILYDISFILSGSTSTSNNQIYIYNK